MCDNSGVILSSAVSFYSLIWTFSNQYQVVGIINQMAANFEIVEM